MNQDWADKVIERRNMRKKLPKNIWELCDKLEILLEEEEEYFVDNHNEGFDPETWKTWGTLRQLLTGTDCIPAKKRGESK